MNTDGISRSILNRVHARTLWDENVTPWHLFSHFSQAAIEGTAVKESIRVLLEVFN